MAYGLIIALAKEFPDEQAGGQLEVFACNGPPKSPKLMAPEEMVFPPFNPPPIPRSGVVGARNNILEMPCTSYIDALFPGGMIHENDVEISSNFHQKFRVRAATGLVWESAADDVEPRITFKLPAGLYFGDLVLRDIDNIKSWGAEIRSDGMWQGVNPFDWESNVMKVMICPFRLFYS